MMLQNQSLSSPTTSQRLSLKVWPSARLPKTKTAKMPKQQQRTSAEPPAWKLKRSRKLVAVAVAVQTVADKVDKAALAVVVLVPVVLADSVVAHLVEPVVRDVVLAVAEDKRPQPLKGLWSSLYILNSSLFQTTFFHKSKAFIGTTAVNIV
jgi:hypothetical protein